MLHNNTIQYTWETKEFEYQEKKKHWFWFIAAGALVLITLAIIMGNFLLGFLILLGTGLMFSQANKQPLMIDVEISEEGINIHQTLHPFETIRAFWIKETKEGENMLIILTSQNMTPIESLILPEQLNPLELREYLLNYIKEQELRESYTERFIKLIGF